jgi:hypothetical protein
MQLVPRFWIEEVLDPHSPRIASEATARVNDSWNRGRGEGGIAINTDEVKSDGQRGTATGALDGVVECRAAHYQASGSEDALAMRSQNSIIHGAGDPEVIGVEDPIG